MAEVLSFFVAGTPAPGGSKKAFVRGGRAVVVDDAKNNASWRERVAAVASGHHRGPLLDAPLAVTFVFFTLRPRGHYGGGRNAARLKPSAPRYPTTKPDALKLARSTEDALSGVVWRDDSTTVDLVVRKRYGDRPGCQVTIQLKGDA